MFLSCGLSVPEEAVEETDAVLTGCCRYIGPLRPASHDLTNILQYSANATAAPLKVATKMFNAARLCELGPYVPNYEG